MENKLFKILLFMKRRPGISLEEFMQYYEEKHVQLVLNYARGMVTYKRQFITPGAHFETGACSDLGFDVITELGFDNEKTFNIAVESLASRPPPGDVIEDENKLFDRSTFRVATCTEFVSRL